MPKDDSGDLVLTEIQRRVVEGPLGRTIFLGGPGAGKSLVLAERAVWLLGNGLADREEMLILAPSRRAAKAVEGLVRRRRAGHPAPPALSFHGLALSILHRHHRELGYHRPPQLLYTGRHFHDLRMMLRAENASTWPHCGSFLRGQILPRMVYDMTMGMAENGLRRDDVVRLAHLWHLAELEELAALAARHRQIQRQAGRIDFGEALTAVRELLRRHPERAGGYRHILVDEFEEAHQAQNEILSLLAGAETDVLVAGDPAQAINGYRSGSGVYLRGLGERLGAQIIVSDENHRSSRRVIHLLATVRPLAVETQRGGVEKAIPSSGVEAQHAASLQLNCAASLQLDSAASLQEAHLHGSPSTDKDSAREGYVVLRRFTHLSDEARWIASEVQSLVGAGAPPTRIAILLRSLSIPLVRLISMELSRRGIPCRFQPSRKVVTDPLLTASWKLLDYLDGEESGGKAFLAVLESPLADLPPFGLRQLRRAAARAHLGLSTLPQANLEVLALSDPLRAAASAFLDRLARLRVLPQRGATTLLWEIWRLFPAFHRDALAGRGGSRALAVLLREVADLEKERGILTLADLRALRDDGYFHSLSAGSPLQAGVALTTVHLAKGREWEIVFLPGLVEGAFPLRPSPQDVVGPVLARDLAPVGGFDPPGSPDLFAARQERHLAEERRIFYVGLARAGRAIYLSHSLRAADGSSVERSSRFVQASAECPVAEEVPVGETAQWPNDVEGAVGHYRQRLCSAEPLEQAQAAYALHRLRPIAPEAMRIEEWWTDIAETEGAAPPFPEGKLYLSTSRLSAYRDCPLAYQYSYHWGLSQPTNSAMTIGSVLHSILEEYHRPGSTWPRTRQALEDLLGKCFDPGAFPYRPLASQARRALRKMLDAYFIRYGDQGPALAVEKKFRFESGPLCVRGYIDRIDRLKSGRLELVDYKTGSARSKEEASQDIQLALYDLAFFKDDHLRRLGVPKKVSYLYLKSLGGPRADGKRGFEPDEQSRARLEERIEYHANGILAECFPSRFAAQQTFSGPDPADLKTLQKEACYFCGFGWICPDKQRGSVD